MKMFSREEALTESIVDNVGGKLGEDYKSLKVGILELVENTMGKGIELVGVKNFMGDYAAGESGKNIIGLVDNVDIFNFYLKYQSNIDEVCNDKKFFDSVPSSKNVFSLYDYIITGTKFAVVEVVKIMVEEIF